MDFPYKYLLFFLNSVMVQLDQVEVCELCTEGLIKGARTKDKRTKNTCLGELRTMSLVLRTED